MQIFDKTTQLLEASLDARLVRQNVLASNLANADTPGFKPKDVDFAAALSQAEKGLQLRDTPGMTDAAPASSEGPPIIDMPGSPPGVDGNSVDLDRAMTAISENAIQYEAAARGVARKLAILKYVASDGSSA